MLEYRDDDVPVSYMYILCSHCAPKCDLFDLFYLLQVSLCDKRLLQICVPDCLSRAPKSLQDISHWKGTLLTYLSGVTPIL